MSLWLQVTALGALTLLLALFRTVYRFYRDKGRAGSRRAHGHIEHFHEHVAPRLKLDPRRALQCFALLAQLTLVLMALALGLATQIFVEPTGATIVETAFLMVVVVLVVYELVPYVLLQRSRGDWLLPLVPLLRLFAYAVVPLQIVYSFSTSVLHLAEEEEESGAGEQPAQAIEDLVEEGQERGILEKEDAKLVASVLQFADKTAREVMTPRPEIVGIAASATLAELRQLMRAKRFSRIPVFGAGLDDAQGVVLMRDLLEVPDAELEKRRVGELMRTVLFVPESKPVIDIVRELQREMQPLAVVVDEYGAVAGLITLEDLAEEMIGEISDADQVRRAEIVKEGEGAWLVRGGVARERFEEALGIALPRQDAATVAGLLHHWFGYVPKPGESLERDGLRVEILEATPRRVVRARVSALAPAAAPKPRRSRKTQPAR